eukprot:TRINITY_DN3846_c0_g1_i1.p1 TRINITY_DN3846_c0_g1~~TRINITY_DN3846_c0_g1_i1.p1  ORF type:complete len:391 (-),score=-19.07 TRINITY_DN3846_c0_g1_i1:209-1381(-)
MAAPMNPNPGVPYTGGPGPAKSYGIWNNKGGVGKSTLTFHLACGYAFEHPQEQVLVIDLCPQANASMMFLGGGIKRPDPAAPNAAPMPTGSEQVERLCLQVPAKTVVGYITEATVQGRFNFPVNALQNFTVQPHQINNTIPSNLFLMCGDPNLELLAPALTNQASPQVEVHPQYPSWKFVHEIVKRFMCQVLNQNWVVFVDTNPSFNIYTAIGVSSVTNLIVPVKADDSSRVGAQAMLKLIFGSIPPHPIWGGYTYAAQALLHGVTKPKVHLIVGNQLHQKSGNVKAYDALASATAEELKQEYETNPHFFSARPVVPGQQFDFLAEYYADLRNFNTTGVVAAHYGMPVHYIQHTYPGGFRQLPVADVGISVNGSEAAKPYDALRNIVLRL